MVGGLIVLSVPGSGNPSARGNEHNIATRLVAEVVLAANAAPQFSATVLRADIVLFFSPSLSHRSVG